MIAPASRKVGKYEILRKLGRGGMADVYLAQDTAGGHTVALKLIEHSSDSDTHDAIEAERRGAELQAHLQAIDPRVVKIYDCNDVDGFFFVAMEYIDGQDLSELLRKGKPGLEFAVDAGIAVAETLDHAHNLCVNVGGKDCRGMVHGDIKPKNIRIDSHGNVRVLDFGIAKALSLSRKLTRNEFGSVPYASPERLNTGEVNFGSDLWSLAVMLYEMVTGMQPYAADSTEQLERKIQSGTPAPRAPDPCPEPLRRILAKALDPDPELRYASAADLAADLRAFRQGAPVRAVAEDLEATRRTTRRRDDETRRTHPLAPAVAAAGGVAAIDESTRRTGRVPQPEPAHIQPQPAEPGKRFGRASRRKIPKWAQGAAALACGFVLYAGGSSYMLYHRGQELKREIDTGQITSPDDVWNKWTEVAGSHSSSWLLSGARNDVKQHLMDAAGQVIQRYESSDHNVKEPDWQTAHDELARALQLDPNDAKVRGEMRLCDGQIDRIEGFAHVDRPALITEAISDFKQAASLMPRSPDPWLGLVPIYIYNLKDFDNAYKALTEAQNRGFTWGPREKNELARGYWTRANRIYYDSRNVRGLPQEKDQLVSAQQDYQHALELYQSAATWGDSKQQIDNVKSALDSVETRLKEIEAEANGLPSPAKIPGPLREILRRILHL